MKLWSNKWKSSKKPGKKRKYKYNAPPQVRRKIMSSHLSVPLKKKYGRRALPIRKEDEVKVMKGEFKGKTGVIDRVDRTNYKVYVKGITKNKKDGTTYKVPFSSSQLMITELKDDKKRIKDMIEKEKVQKDDEKVEEKKDEENKKERVK